MRSLFHSDVPSPAPTAEPVPTIFPKIEGADLAAVFVGKRVAGDFYDSLRVSPERVLFALLDVAGRREDNRAILAAAQETFRSFGTELFSRPDINESESMTELVLRINRGLIEACKGVHSSPAFIACYHEKFGTLCYSNAGHTPGLLRDGSGITELGATGLPLGLFSHATTDAPTVGLEKGAALLLVSRGVVECERRLEIGRRIRPGACQTAFSGCSRQRCPGTVRLCPECRRCLQRGRTLVRRPHRPGPGTH